MAKTAVLLIALRGGSAISGSGRTSGAKSIFAFERPAGGVERQPDPAGPFVAFPTGLQHPVAQEAPNGAMPREVSDKLAVVVDEVHRWRVKEGLRLGIEPIMAGSDRHIPRVQQSREYYYPIGALISYSSLLG